MKFKVGYRVAAYQFIGLPYYENRLTGTVKAIKESYLLIEFDAYPNTEHHQWLHEKQCRLLVKKKKKGHIDDHYKLESNT